MNRYRALLLGLIASVAVVAVYLAADHWRHVTKLRNFEGPISGPGGLSIAQLLYFRCRASFGDADAAGALSKYYGLFLEDEVAGKYWGDRSEELRAQELRARGIREPTFEEVRNLRLKADAGDPDAAEALAKLWGGETREDKAKAEAWLQRARELRKTK